MFTLDGNETSVNSHKTAKTNSDLYKYFSNFNLNSGDCQMLNTTAPIDITGKIKRLKNDVIYKVLQGSTSKSEGIPIKTLQPLSKAKQIINDSNFNLDSIFTKTIT